VRRDYSAKQQREMPNAHSRTKLRPNMSAPPPHTPPAILLRVYVKTGSHWASGRQYGHWSERASGK
jgi:hypothetical protein